jgi:ATP-binding cassette, subfamily B, bacterial
MSQLEEDTFTGRFDFQLWKRLIGFAKPYSLWIAGLAMLAIGVAACDALFALFSKWIIDHLQAGGNWDGLFPILLQFGLLLVCFAVLIFAFIIVAGHIQSGVSHDIREAAFKKLQQLPFSYFDRRAVGWIMSRLTGDCNQLSRVMGWALLDIFWGTTAIFLVSCVMFYHSPKLAVIVLSISVPLFFVCRWFQTRLLKTNRALRKANSIATGSYNEGIVGVRTTKSLVREHQNAIEFQDLSTGIFKQAFRAALYSAAFMPIVLALCNLAVGLALWRGGLDVIAGTITLGTLVLFTSYATFLMHPAQELANTFTVIQGAQASAERIIGLLDEPLEIIDDSVLIDTRLPADERVQTITFKDVQFQYKTGPVVLHDFNFAVEPGQSIALVGATGGGKSTIVSLLCRFYEPTRGQVLINGIDYRRRPLKWLHTRLGMVPQQPHLFSGTIRENIRYGKLSATDAEIESVAKLCHAHEFITKLKDGYDAKVGEGGNQLSTGQKQLIALSRAILADPQIFVLDEATSSVDTHTEKAIQSAVEQAMHGRISFVIAHRLSTIKRCTRIVVIDAGRIVEQGNHHDLLAARGRYYELYTQQFTAEHEEHLFASDDPEPVARASGT